MYSLYLYIYKNDDKIAQDKNRDVKIRRDGFQKNEFWRS